MGGIASSVTKLKQPNDNVMSDSTNSSTKFKVANQNAEPVKNSKKSSDSSICSQMKAFKSEHCTELLMASQFSSSVQASANNGFVQTVIDCYNKHHNLVIRPDDIWMAILTQFSFYINKNAEEFRNQFVNFEGKKTLSVSINGSLRSAPYDLFVTKMTEKIDENLVDKTVKDWILPNFTTTTTNDIISCGVVFMATTKKYFQFECCLMCGIPYVTLEGTVADWECILNRLKKLKDYKLDKWYGMLKPILEEFVAAKKHKPNIEFWNRICNRFGGGSGPSYISGWVTAFAAFDENGVWMNEGIDSSRLLSAYGCDDDDEAWLTIDLDKIPSGIVNVDVKIIEGDEEHESIMFAGHVGYEVQEDNCTLKPQIGWGMALKLTAEEVEKVHETARGNFFYSFRVQSFSMHFFRKRSMVL